MIGLAPFMDDSSAGFPALEQTMNLSFEQRETLSRWLPTLLAVAAIWLLARGFKRLLWTAFGIGWVIYWSGGRFPLWF